MSYTWQALGDVPSSLAISSCHSGSASPVGATSLGSAFQAGFNFFRWQCSATPFGDLG